jgi:hypothetical protein
VYILVSDLQKRVDAHCLATSYEMVTASIPPTTVDKLYEEREEKELALKLLF